MQRHSFPAHARLNMDETRLVPKHRQRVVVSGSSHKVNQRMSRLTCLATLVPVVAADGSVLVSFIILKANKAGTVQRFQRITRFRGRPTWPHYVAATTSGFTNRRLWVRMLEKVKFEWQLKHPGLNCILYIDNCSPHRSAKDATLKDDFILGFKREQIHCFFLPPNTTAWLQPLDDVAFGNLKLVLGREHRDCCFDAAVSRDADGILTLDDAIEAEFKALSAATIKASWRNTGMSLEPEGKDIDPRKIRSLAVQNYGCIRGVPRSIMAKAAKLTLGLLSTSGGKARSSSQPLTLTLDEPFTTDQIEELRRTQKRGKAQVVQSREQLRTQKESDRQEKAKRKQAEREAKADERRLAKSRAQLLKTRKKEKAKRRKAKRDRQNRCVGCCKWYRAGMKWSQCEYCDMVSACTKCPEGETLLEEHEQQCSGTSPKKSRKS